MNDYIQETLEFVNDIRKTLSLRPLAKLQKGTRGYACGCPVSNSVRHEDNANKIYSVVTRTRRVKVNMRPQYGKPLHFTQPAAVQWFVREFDNGNLLQYTS